MLRRALLILALCAACDGSRSSDALDLVERTVQLSPEGSSPTFTMRMPSFWMDGRPLTGPGPGGKIVLVNARGEPNEDYESRAGWADHAHHRGGVELGISCPDACGRDLEQAIFARQHDPSVTKRVIEEVETATDHTLITETDEGAIDILRTWHVPDDSRFRLCFIRVFDAMARSYPVLARTCAEIVER